MPEKKNLKKEWDDASEAWTDFVRKGKDHCRTEMNNPATFKLIGEVKGKRVLDVACGEGYNTRILAKKGAQITGVDFSKKLIELAKQEEAKENLGICYHVLDATHLKRLSSDHFDIVTCFMALQDIEDYETAISEVARVLRNNGRFVFSIPHPCFETIIVKAERVKAWQRYFGPIKYPIHWNMERLEKPFRTTSFHRAFTDYFNALYKNRLFVSRLVEPKPTKRGLLKHPSLREHLITPESVVMEAVKIKDGQ